MNQKNNTTLIAVIAIFSSLAVIILIAVAVFFSIATNRLKKETPVPSPTPQVEATDGTVGGDDSLDTEPTIEPVIQQPTTMYVANVRDSIYLRSAPVENESNIITTIPVGTQVVWLENTDTVFSKISYGGSTGYVKRDYLSASAPQPNNANSGNTFISKYMYVANVENSIYLRSEPNENQSNIITTIPLGTEVGYIERTNNVFSKINYNGTIGYAKTIYLADYYNTNYNYLTVYNVQHSIYLRSEPYEDPDNIICEIPLGTVVRYLGTANSEFYKISYDGYIGYSKSIYLR